MTHLTGPRPRKVAALKRDFLELILQPGRCSLSEARAGLMAAEEDLYHRLLKISGLEKDCTTCHRRKKRKP